MHIAPNPTSEPGPAKFLRFSSPIPLSAFRRESVVPGTNHAVFVGFKHQYSLENLPVETAFP
jgi:hypothetical protein